MSSHETRPYVVVNLFGTPLQHAFSDCATRDDGERIAAGNPSFTVHAKADVLDPNRPGDMNDDIGPGPWPLRRDLRAHV